MYALIFVIVIFIINSYFTYYQLNEYKKSISKIKKNYSNYYISTGKSRKIFSKGSIVILVISKTGILHYGEEMLGRTVFAKFKKIDNLYGLTTYEAKEIYKNSESFLQAINFFEQLQYK